MNIFERILKIGQAEGHSAINMLENPIKMTEQGIRDLKKDLNQCLHSLAEVKALAIRAKQDMETSKHKVLDYERKAMLLLEKAEEGSLDASEADRLAAEALQRKQECMRQSEADQKNYHQFSTNASSLAQNVKQIKSKIASYENELKTLKARIKVSSASKKLNKQIANIDSSGTVAMLERMKNKVVQDEALAASYGEIANEHKSLDDEIHGAIGGSDTQSAVQAELLAMKKKLGHTD